MEPSSREEETNTGPGNSHTNKGEREADRSYQRDKRRAGGSAMRGEEQVPRWNPP